MKRRREDNWLYGIHAVIALVTRRPAAVREVWIAGEARNPRLAELRGLTERNGIPLKQVSSGDLERRAGGVPHQGVVAEFDPAAITRGERELGDLLSGIRQTPLLLVLDGVQDPHNLGACLRTADAAGAHAVIAPRDRAVGITPVVCKAASGAVGHVPFFQVTNLARTLRALREAGIWIAGADMDGETPLFSADLSVPLALVLGGEGKGLRRLTRELCDLRVAIPVGGAVESLNVSVAAGVCLYEAARQRAASAGGSSAR